MCSFGGSPQFVGLVLAKMVVKCHEFGLCMSVCVQGKEGFKNARKGTIVAAHTTATSAALVSALRGSFAIVSVWTFH